MSEDTESPRAIRLEFMLGMLVATLLTLYCGTYLYLRLFKVSINTDEIVIINVDSDTDYPLELPSSREAIAHRAFAPIVWLESTITGRTVHIE
jgi:hypothetical protein